MAQNRIAAPALALLTPLVLLVASPGAAENSNAPVEEQDWSFAFVGGMGGELRIAIVLPSGHSFETQPHIACSGDNAICVYAFAIIAPACEIAVFEPCWRTMHLSGGGAAANEGLWIDATWQGTFPPDDAACLVPAAGHCELPILTVIDQCEAPAGGWTNHCFAFYATVADYCQRTTSNVQASAPLGGTAYITVVQTCP